MTDLPEFVDPSADFEACNPLRPDAVRLPGTTRGGKPCILVNNTGKALPETELRAILAGLIENDAFGIKGRSASGANTIALARREATHIQIGADLYRLIVYRYEARIEPF